MCIEIFQISMSQERALSKRFSLCLLPIPEPTTGLCRRSASAKLYYFFVNQKFFVKNLTASNKFESRESRQVYLRRNDRIIANFITCFLALLIFRTLKIRLNMPDITTSQLRKKLIDMNYLQIRGEGYMPVFEDDDITTLQPP